MQMQIEQGETILSEDNAEQDDGTNLKLVPVSESIRYRKRAQGAEKKAETLAEELSQAKSQIAEMNEQLRNVQLEQKLVKKLVAAGAVDLETAVLVAKAKIGDVTSACRRDFAEGEETDLDGCVEQLKKEKQYLFSGPDKIGETAKRTAGVRDRTTSGQTSLERAASRAAKSGSRTDLQEYLRLRRNFV